MLGIKRTKGKRNRNTLVAGSIIETVKSINVGGQKATFSEILKQQKSKRVISNHRSLRVYLDSLVASGLLVERTEPGKQPNVRARQVYSLKTKDPSIEVGEKAMNFHGLNWTLPTKSSRKVKTDIEGVVRAKLEGETLYGSLEDTIVENLVSARGKSGVDRGLLFCAALLATSKFDNSYLLQRANEKGVGGLIRELLDEVDYLLTSTKPEVEDIKSLYEIRKSLGHTPRSYAARTRNPQWSLFSPEELMDTIGKQIGLE